MADAYLAISLIANDPYMVERVRSCATQQQHLGAVDMGGDPVDWTNDNRYLWASSPGWGEKWDYALATHVVDSTNPDDPNLGYAPGADPAVITDAEVLSAVQALAPTA